MVIHVEFKICIFIKIIKNIKNIVNSFVAVCSLAGKQNKFYKPFPENIAYYQQQRAKLRKTYPNKVFFNEKQLNQFGFTKEIFKTKTIYYSHDINNNNNNNNNNDADLPMATPPIKTTPIKTIPNIHTGRKKNYIFDKTIRPNRNEVCIDDIICLEKIKKTYDYIVNYFVYKYLF